MKTKTKTIITHRKLCLKDTIIACIPFIVTMGVFIMMLIEGLNYAGDMFLNDPMYPIIVCIWLIICQSFIKHVPFPVTTWDVRTEEYEE